MESKSTLVHVGVRASDLDKSIRFWRDGLELEVYSTIGDRCYELTDGYHNFRVFQHQGAERPAHVRGMLDYLPIGVRVPDLAEAAARLQAMGFTIFWDGVSGGGEGLPSRLTSFRVVQSGGSRWHYGGCYGQR